MDSERFGFQWSIGLIIAGSLFFISLALATEDIQGIDGIFQYAESLFKNQQYTAAESEYLQLLSIDSQYRNVDIARYRLGWCAYYSEKYELAVMQFTILIQSFPKSSLLNSAKQARQYVYENAAIIPTVGSDPALIPFNLARKRQRENNEFDALAFYERVVQNYPESVYAVYAAYDIAQIQAANYDRLTQSYLEKTSDYQRARCEKNDPRVLVQLYAEAALQEELMQQQKQHTIIAYARITERYPDSFL
jgi:tetratricopeptide (TPR) repeat protein